jgi:glycosyltransferase involved in cell wall biosynthesis
MKSRIVKTEPEFVLSVGMIVKNEEKWLEKCLTALQPLFDGVSSELVIVDTGSTDRTLEIARQFTDKLYNFEWTGDFSAARNFGWSKCSGEWFMFIDADEIVSDGIDDMIAFFNNRKERDAYNAAAYTLHNQTKSKGALYRTQPVRIVKCFPGLEFTGLIHEHWNQPTLPVKLLDTVLQHWGYYYETDEERMTKVARNDAILSAALELEPDNVRLNYQLLCEKGTRGRIEILPRLLDLARKQSRSSDFSTCIFLIAVQTYGRKEVFDPDEIVKLCEEYLEIFEYIGEHVMLIDIYAGLGMAYARKERNDEALKAFEEYFRLCELYTQKKLLAGIGMAALYADDSENHERIRREYEYLKSPPVALTLEDLSQSVRTVPNLANTMTCEQMAVSVNNISGNPHFAKAIVDNCIPEKFIGSIKQLFWAVTASEQAVLKSQELSEEDKAALFTNFSHVVSIYVSNVYNSALFNDDDIGVLPPLHRFGYYLAVSQNALEAKDSSGYIAALGKALKQYPEMKDVVEFLTKRMLAA